MNFSFRSLLIFRTTFDSIPFSIWRNWFINGFKTCISFSKTSFNCHDGVTCAFTILSFCRNNVYITSKSPDLSFSLVGVVREFDFRLHLVFELKTKLGDFRLSPLLRCFLFNFGSFKQNTPFPYSVKVLFLTSTSLSTTTFSTSFNRFSTTILLTTSTEVIYNLKMTCILSEYNLLQR